MGRYDEMRKLTLLRICYTKEATYGVLFLDGRPYCATLEPPARIGKPRCVPTGNYRVQHYPSPKRKRLVLLLIDVPGFEMIEIHEGNRSSDSSGCIIVGESFLRKDAEGVWMSSFPWVNNSRPTLRWLENELKDEVNIVIEITEEVLVFPDVTS